MFGIRDSARHRHGENPHHLPVVPVILERESTLHLSSSKITEPHNYTVYRSKVDTRIARQVLLVLTPNTLCGSRQDEREGRRTNNIHRTRHVRYHSIAVYFFILYSNGNNLSFRLLDVCDFYFSTLTRRLPCTCVRVFFAAESLGGDHGFDV